MGLNSTRFITFHEISTDTIDLYEDAFGMYPQFIDVIEVLKKLKPFPDKTTTERLIARIKRVA